MAETPSNSTNRRAGNGSLAGSGWWEALTAALYTESQAERWGVSVEQFAAWLERSVRKRFGDGCPATPEVEGYARALHLEDLGLACACAQGCEAAWEEFVHGYRGYLRAAAAVILRCGSGTAEATELADSLFAELFGLSDGKRGERSLFRYFHGRSSLKTWLRAVLAQRQVDAVRTTRRLEPLDDDEDGHRDRVPAGKSEAADPHRARYLALFSRALDAALSELAEKDRWRLRAYYSDQFKLAEIGRQLGEHESSVSRNLERIRLELRVAVENLLRAGKPASDGETAEKGLSDAEIALSFEYAAEDVPIDLQKLFAQKNRQGPGMARQKT
jgi:RNA polymerase sigma factor (sigma-70 family)